MGFNKLITIFLSIVWLTEIRVDGIVSIKTFSWHFSLSQWSSFKISFNYWELCALVFVSSHGMILRRTFTRSQEYLKYFVLYRCVTIDRRDKSLSFKLDQLLYLSPFMIPIMRTKKRTLYKSFFRAMCRDVLSSIIIQNHDLILIKYRQIKFEFYITSLERLLFLQLDTITIHSDRNIFVLTLENYGTSVARWSDPWSECDTSFAQIHPDSAFPSPRDMQNEHDQKSFLTLQCKIASLESSDMTTPTRRRTVAAVTTESP